MVFFYFDLIMFGYVSAYVTASARRGGPRLGLGALYDDRLAAYLPTGFVAQRVLLFVFDWLIEVGLRLD